MHNDIFLNTTIIDGNSMQYELEYKIGITKLLILSYSLTNDSPKLTSKNAIKYFWNLWSYGNDLTHIHL